MADCDARCWRPMRGLSRRCARSLVLIPGRAVTLAGVAAFSASVWANVVADPQWGGQLWTTGAFMAGWGCICLTLLCTVVFPEARSGLDGAIGLLATLTALPVSIGTFPRDAHFATWFFFFGAGVAPAVCGIFLAVLTLRTRHSEGGTDAHPQI